MVARLHQERIAAVAFESANPTIVKSIKQRDLLNTWLRLYARDLFHRAPGRIPAGDVIEFS
jgi:hypothetical protein